MLWQACVYINKNYNYIICNKFTVVIIHFISSIIYKYHLELPKCVTFIFQFHSVSTFLFPSNLLELNINISKSTPICLPDISISDIFLLIWLISLMMWLDMLVMVVLCFSFTFFRLFMSNFEDSDTKHKQVIYLHVWN